MKITRKDVGIPETLKKKESGFGFSSSQFVIMKNGKSGLIFVYLK